MITDPNSPAQVATLREVMAVAILHGLLVKQGRWADPKGTAELAVNTADCLITALNHLGGPDANYHAGASASCP